MSKLEYKCIKEFLLLKCDGDGFLVDGEGIVPKDSVWYETDSNVTGGEMRLDCKSGCDDFGWIEISKETLRECFEGILGGGE